MVGIDGDVLPPSASCFLNFLFLFVAASFLLTYLLTY